MTELIDRISAALVGLKMPRALEALGPTLRRLKQGEITAVEAIDALLSEDCALRETRRIDIALRTAKLLPVKTVESFDFAFQPSLDRERIAALAQLDFIRRRETVHFLGPLGTGKSHLATALLDRLHHHAVVVRIEGASYRPGKHADLIPEHVRTNAPITPPPKKRGRPKKETRTDD